VGISLEAHILREVFRFHQFADVMKIRADAAEGCIRVDGFRRGFGQIGHDKAMVIVPGASIVIRRNKDD
jgi:hypothetical protein